MQSTAQQQPTPTAAAPRYEIAEAAKLLGIGKLKLFKLLRNKKILDAGNTPYQQYIDAGYFKLHRGAYQHPTLGTKFYARTDVTNKGMVWIQNLIEKHEANQ